MLHTQSSAEEPSQCLQTSLTTLEAPSPVKGYYMSLASLGTPCSREVRVLWDTGAMPTIICESVLPIGTEILPSTARLTGMSNKVIPVKGEAYVYFQLGRYQYQQLMIVVPQDTMQFPEKSTIILGANFLSHYQLNIDSASWCIT